MSVRVVYARITWKSILLIYVSVSSLAKLYAHLLVTYQFFVCCRRRSAIKEK